MGRYHSRLGFMRFISRFAGVLCGRGVHAVEGIGVEIRFRFNLDKALHAMAYVVDRLGAVDKVKLMKLIYLADRDHFLKHGYPVTGDRQCAMPHGPVPSSCLAALNGESWPKPNAAFEYLHIDDNRVMLKAKPKDDWLTTEEKQTLEGVLAAYGGTSTWRLRDQTHKLPEYKEVYVEGTSTTIPYELMLKLYKDESGFRHNRPVITEATLERMAFPFTANRDADL